ncbi:MAG TPA: TauD/TfdA family dioxygenase, partial [Polyangiales bacterium]
MTTNAGTHSTDHVEVHPIAGRIGAEIRGVRLATDLPLEVRRQIHEAWLEHKVLFFRRQHHLDHAAQEALTTLFGPGPVAHPTVPTLDGTKFITELDSRYGGRANSWHTDVTFVEAYPKASILRAVTVPAFGGDTTWANTAAAYESLSPELRALADTLWALHTNEYDYLANKKGAAERGSSEEELARYQEVFTSTVYETEHPVVHVHPETGEKHLLLGHFVKKILNVPSADSAHLLQLLQAHVTRLEHTVRWRWEAGDVAILDNRATQHYAINDYGDQLRVMRRVTVDGVAPVSVDGRRSVNRKQVVRGPKATAHYSALANAPVIS